MTTKLPRIAFVPSEPVRALLQEISVLTGQSMGSLVSELMDEVAPVVQGQITALRQIAGRPDAARELVRDYTDKAIAEIAQIGMDFQSSADARSTEGMKSKRRAARAVQRP